VVPKVCFPIKVQWFGCLMLVVVRSTMIWLPTIGFHKDIQWLGCYMLVFLKKYYGLNANVFPVCHLLVFLERKCVDC
jgi:hypothetical protein